MEKTIVHHIDTRFTGCGYSIGEDSLEVTKLPDHKRPQLLFSRGVNAEILATFSDDDAARKFVEWMNKIAVRMKKENEP